MGSLTTFLQREFARCCPPNWVCRYESPLLPRDLERILGYAPRADIVLERRDGARRLWIEFEVSRADPVANHAKFATAHLFSPRPPTDAFVAMISPHVARGRRNLAAATIVLMRHLGLDAFQTVLLPHLAAAEVQRLNHAPLDQLHAEGLAIDEELGRALNITDPVGDVAGHRIFLASDLLSIVLNVRQWNQDVLTARGSELWRNRTVTFFAYDPQTGDFAPAKFCAYVAIPGSPGQSGVPSGRTGVMTIDTYVQAESLGRRLDGHVARTHLTRGLAMVRSSPADAPAIFGHFDTWLRHHQAQIHVHPDGPVMLLPPAWFR